MFSLAAINTHWFWVYETGGWIIAVGMVLVILRRQFAAGAALAWLGIVFLHPYVGLVLYLMIGETRLGLERTARHREMVSRYRVGAGHTEHGVERTYYGLLAAYEPMVLQVEKISGMPVAGGNAVTFFPESAGLVEQLVADIGAAKTEVHLLYYIFVKDATGLRVVEALESAARGRVRCRVLVDAVASRDFFHWHGLAKRLKAAGVSVAAALPVAPLRRRLRRMDLRNHRKLAVLDGRIAFVGSHNLINPDYGGRRGAPWVDLTARVTGEIVDQLAVIFAEDWAFETGETMAVVGSSEGKKVEVQKGKAADEVKVKSGGGEVVSVADGPPAKGENVPQGEARVTWDSQAELEAGREEGGEAWSGEAMQAVPTGPSAPGESFRRVFLGSLQCARRRVILTTPYFVPDEPTLIALLMAADRGVEVSLIVPANPDHALTAAAGRAHFSRLLEAGIRIYQYRPGLIHSKTTTVDDAFGIVGSANLDVRSFNLNFELGVVMYGRAVTQRLRKIQEGYLADSTRLTLEVWGKRSAVRRYADSAISLLSPLL